MLSFFFSSFLMHYFSFCVNMYVFNYVCCDTNFCICACISVGVLVSCVQVFLSLVCFLAASVNSQVKRFH